MSTPWMMRGVEYGNCNCDWGCPCQFNAVTTHGNCEAVVAGHIEEGHHGDTRLDGLNWAFIAWWPGEIADGNGRFQAIVDERADDAQREAIRRIVHGEDTTPGATAFWVYGSTVTEVLDTLYLPIELEIDVDARTAKVVVPGVIESVGAPIINRHSGNPHRAQIRLAEGFEYTVAEMGNGNSKTTGAIELELTDSYGQFNLVHTTHDGVVR